MIVTEKEILETKRKYGRKYIDTFRKRHPERFTTQQLMSRARTATRLGISEEEILNSVKIAIKQVRENELVETR